MKGTVLDFNIQTNSGIITGSDEQRYNFKGHHWKEPSTTPKRGLKVDFVLDDDGLASDIFLAITPSSSSPFGHTPSGELNGFMQFLKNYEIANVLCAKKTTDYKTRSSREEYWLYQLSSVVILFLTFIFIDSFFEDPDSAVVIFSLAVISVAIPNLALGVRRLHDIGRSGWWTLIALVPFVGYFILLFFMLQPSQPQANQWGDVPEPIANQEQQ